MLLFDDLQLVFLCLGNSLKCDGGGVDYSWLGGIEGEMHCSGRVPTLLVHGGISETWDWGQD